MLEWREKEKRGLGAWRSGGICMFGAPVLCPQRRIGCAAADWISHEGHRARDVNMKAKAKTTEKRAPRSGVSPHVRASKTQAPKQEPRHEERFNQLLDDAVLGVKKG